MGTTIPWAREGSGFTLLFERRIIDLAPVMPINTLGQKLGVTDTRVWRLVEHYLSRALEKLKIALTQGATGRERRAYL